MKGHITAGALVIDKKGNVLLNHHKILDKWLHFGGHSDNDSNSLNVAKREVMEESGIVDVEDFGGKIFDVDVHTIPENLEKKSRSTIIMILDFYLLLMIQTLRYQMNLQI